VIGYAEGGRWRSPMTCSLLQCRIPKFRCAKPAPIKRLGYFPAAILRLSLYRWVRVLLLVMPLWLHLAAGGEQPGRMHLVQYTAVYASED